MRTLVKLALTAVLLAALSASAAELAVLRNGFSIRHQSRESLGDMTRLHTTSGYVDVPTSEIADIQPDDMPAPPPAAAPPQPAISALVGKASDRHQIDADLITSVIRAESSFNPRAVSPKGAQGLMQLMPQTAARLGVADPMDPGTNVEGGTRYLRELLLRYHGDLAKALAAYNAGPHRVEQYRGVPPYRETHAYVARIIREFNQKKLAARRAQKSSKQPAAGN